MKRARNPDQLREVFAARDLTYRELARIADCSHAMVPLVLAGRPLGDDLARRIARVLRRPVGDLFVDAASSDVQDDQCSAVVA